MKKQPKLIDWFYMSEQEVLDKFAAIPGAIKIGEGSDQSIYIKGSKKNCVLLIAHADTVFTKHKVDVGYKDNTYFSKNKECGIGADDRAGIAILWQLRNLGHSVLVPNAEERGRCASRFIMKDEKHKEEMNSHQFMIEFDRKGNNDLIYYDVSTKDFEEWCPKVFNGYSKGYGSFTDISTLCEKICGLNISIGYYDQHHTTETLKQNEWNRTLDIARKVLSSDDLPKFVLTKPKFVPYQSHQMGGYDGYDDGYCGHYPSIDRDHSDRDDYYKRLQSNVNESAANLHEIVGDRRIIVKNKKIVLPDENDVNFTIKTYGVCCPKCEGMMDISEYLNNNKKCSFAYCGYEFSIAI